MKKFMLFATLVMVSVLSGCTTKPQSFDDAAFKQSNPKSILVLPPINHTNDIVAPYSVLANVTEPLAEAGYYVFPVVLVDETFKNNGLTVAEDIHQVPVAKLYDIFGADTALYIEVEEYGTSYAVVSSDTVVMIKAKLIDLKTNVTLWQGHASASSSEQNEDNAEADNGIVGLLVGAAVTQIIETIFDSSFQVSAIATERLLSPATGHGLLYGPRSPKYQQDKPTQ